MTGRRRGQNLDEQVHTLIGPYALDAVTDTERAAVERHLARCPTCTQEVAELRATAARLADTAATDPPTTTAGPGPRTGPPNPAGATAAAPPQR
jgi:anti-sigma factor RsiW